MVAESNNFDDRAAPPLAHVPALDGVRGLAIAAVLIHHGIGIGPHAAPGRLEETIERCAAWGWIGVDLFFALSGFLITGILLDSRGERGWLRAFYARRFLRIVPLYYLFIASALVLGSVVHPTENQHWLVRSQGWFWSFLQNWLYPSQGWRSTPLSTGHTWSICIEEQFYAVWPFIIWIGGIGRRLVAVTAALMVVALACRCTAVAAGEPWFVPYVSTWGHIDALAAGAAVAVACRLERADRLRRAAWIVVIAAAVALLVAVAAGVKDRGAWMMSGGLSLLAVACAAFVALGALDRGRLSAALTSRWLCRLGRRSYAIYLLHFQVMVTFGGFWRVHLEPKLGTSIAWQAVFTVATALAAWGIAECSWVLLERPVLSLKRLVPTPVRARAQPLGAGATETAGTPAARAG